MIKKYLILLMFSNFTYFLTIPYNTNIYRCNNVNLYHLHLFKYENINNKYNKLLFHLYIIININFFKKIFAQ